MPPKACGIITAQLIYKLQVLFKQQDMRKNEKYCLVLVQICVPIFSLSLVFLQRNSSVVILICFCWEGHSASCCGLPSHLQPWAICHPIQNTTISIRIWPLAPKMTHLALSMLWNCPLKGEKEKLGWVLCHSYHKSQYPDRAAKPLSWDKSQLQLPASSNSPEIRMVGVLVAMLKGQISSSATDNIWAWGRWHSKALDLLLSFTFQKQTKKNLHTEKSH